MLQQIVALAIILFFVFRLAGQKRKKQIGSNEFWLWLVFWIFAAVAIIFIKDIDRLVKLFGFSGSGINFLIYLAVLALFYLIFRLRLDLAKMNKNLTEISKRIALSDKK
jgi:hypothetical protein